ncbi:possible thiamine biosynthesis enzyme [Pseudozyma hubeiensis SY62]|uniref:Possible thiamine biosynthesis enzyme n=1 Tax=Pseudozyma hubeiensis (strain SY62) TaxID=1305764 RepID=R9P264_PSEHS|nr:possible thiamine biosynthesis enzyme [Pseudozyma hubeiensis SY62]GAC95458.1 possible thiamine biosynthesis enzyme [Pseudozyma hubeiensis SY62]
MTDKKLRIGYVPEHFAAPLHHLAATSWGQSNIELVSQPSGTGQMLTSLDASQMSGQKIDVAVALTEALITGIAKGRSDYKLVGSYVRTSLNWAVITGTKPYASSYNSIDDLKGTKIGISRIGSGSQIMASVMALQHGWNTTTIGGGADAGSAEIEFKVNDTFQNLRDGVNGKEGAETSCFMWEWYTTKPYVDSGEVRFIGNVPTPWPSWTIAASCNTALSNSSTKLAEFLAKLQESIREFANTETRQNGQAKEWIVNHHQYKEEDVESWLKTVRWVGEDMTDPEGVKVPTTGQNTTTQTVSSETIKETLQVLEKAGVLNSDIDVKVFVDDEKRLVA